MRILSSTEYKPKGGIYSITVDDVGTYYGETDNIARRWAKHRKQLANGRHHNIKLRRAYRYQGPKKFHFNILAQSQELDNSKTLRLTMEKALILADPLNLNTALSQAVAITEQALPNKPIYRNRPVIYLQRVPRSGYAQVRLGKGGQLLGIEDVEGKWRMGSFKTDSECRLTRLGR